jgi:predicted membrane protein
MRNSGVLFFGGVLILIGILILAGGIFNVNMWAYFWPILLILLGLWFLVRPRWNGSKGPAEFLIFNNLRRRGTWQVKGEEIWVLIGDVFLDLTSAEIPSGETVYRIYGFIGDVDLIVPPDVGVSVSSAAFVNEVKVFGKKQSSILIPVEMASEAYETAERKIRLDVAFFISDVKVKPPK